MILDDTINASATPEGKNQVFQIVITLLQEEFPHDIPSNACHLRSVKAVFELVQRKKTVARMALEVGFLRVNCVEPPSTFRFKTFACPTSNDTRFAVQPTQQVWRRKKTIGVQHCTKVDSLLVSLHIDSIVASHGSQVCQLSSTKVFQKILVLHGLRHDHDRRETKSEKKTPLQMRKPEL